MNWRDQKDKIRRFLRDPDKNIWTDAFLVRCFNDEQRDIQHKTGILESIQAIRVPPQYQMAYLFDWEWRYRDSDGKNYQAFSHYHQSNKVFMYRWETQNMAGINAGESDEGSHFTQPWEAWHADGAVGDLVPVWLPVDFYKAQFIAWDKEPIEYLRLKDIQSADASWVTHSGKVFAYTRLDELSNEIVLYPRPSSPVFDDVEGSLNDGMALFVEDDTVNQEFGALLSRTGAVSNQDYGLTIDVVETDDNLLVIYDTIPTDIESTEDESDFPEFMQKYIEYGVLERAYSSNTDGRIESLRDYWSQRKNLGLEALKRFQQSRKTDRDYRLTTKGVPGFRTRKEPRLPDEYPAIPRF